jgi:predicted nucleic acid-binding protein
LRTSITVIGEMVNTSFEKDTFDLYQGIELLKKLEFDIIFPVQELREWCIIVDQEMEAVGRYGSSVTDRTHFAYALAYGCDYYVTSKGETRTLKAPKEKGGFTEVVTIEELLAKLELS